MVELKPTDDIEEPTNGNKDWWWGTCWDEWWRNDQLDTIWWALAFIWGGLVLLAHTTGYWPSFDWWNAWAVFFVGAGITVLVGTLIRLLVPEFRRKLVPSLIFGSILLAIGLGDLAFWVWPLILVAIGIGILRSAMTARH